MSKRCAICKTPWDQTELFEGVYDNEMIMVCKDCAREESVPILRKPTKEQLSQADKRYSVRERMERMSGMHQTNTQLSKEQKVVQRNLGKLKMPEPKQTHPDVLDNFYWTLNMARRRKKMTINQLSNQTGVSVLLIDAIEKGKIPTDFEQIFTNLESYFGIKLLKHHKSQINYVINSEEENELIEEVKNKISHAKTFDEETELEDVDRLRRQRGKKLKDIQDGNLDFSKRENLNTITLNDLVDMKKKREQRKIRQNIQEKTEDLFGEDLELEDA